MRAEIREMEVDEVRKYPKTKPMRAKLDDAKTAMYCKGRRYIVTTKRSWDYILIKRVN